MPTPPAPSVFPFPAAVVQDGIACYHPDIATAAEADYPQEHFDHLISVEDGHFWFEARNTILKHLVQHFLPARADGTRFLEIGCGTGFVLRMLAGLTGFRVAGAEVHLAGAKMAAARVPEIEVVQLDVLRMEFGAVFDGIGVFDVIEHLEEDVAALRRIRAALKPDGLCFISVPQHSWLWSPQDDMAGHKRRYSRRMMREHLAAAGLEPVFLTSYCFALMPFFAISRLLKKRLSKEQAEKELMNEISIAPWLNRVFHMLLRIDVACALRNISLPCGGSLIAIARASK